MTIREVLASLDSDLCDDFCSGSTEDKAKILRAAGVSEADIAAYLSPEQDERCEPDHAHAGESVEDTQQKSLKWTKAQTLLTAAGVLIAALALAVAVVSCQRG